MLGRYPGGFQEQVFRLQTALTVSLFSGAAVDSQGGLVSLMGGNTAPVE